MEKKERLLNYYCKRNKHLNCLKINFLNKNGFDEVFEIAKIIAIEASADIMVKYGDNKMYPAEIFMKYRQFVELNI